MQYSGMPCNTVECNALECNVMQCYAMRCKAGQWNAKEEYLKSRFHPYHGQCTGQSEIPLSFTFDPYVSDWIGSSASAHQWVYATIPAQVMFRGLCKLVQIWGRSSSPRRVEGELNVDDEGLFNVQVLARPFQILRRRITVKVWSSNGQKQLEAGRIPVLIPNIVTGWRGHVNHYCCGVGYWCTWFRYPASYLSGETNWTANTQEHIAISLLITGSMTGGHASPGNTWYRL